MSNKKKNYFNLNPEEIEKMKDINYFIDCEFLKKYFQKDIHFRHQSNLIDLNNVDFVGRLENIEIDLII